MTSRFSPARDNESGFTLVELLVVIAIIAILTAIAVPSFLNQRQKANDASVRSDMKSVVTTIETGLVDNSGAVAVATTTGTAAVTIGGVNVGDVKLSKNNTVTSVTNSTDAHYGLSGSNTAGSGTFYYDNTDGGFVTAAPTIPAP